MEREREREREREMEARRAKLRIRADGGQGRWEARCPSDRGGGGVPRSGRYVHEVRDSSR
jgi:hypothetical protein